MANTVYDRGNHAPVLPYDDANVPSDSDFGQDPPDGTIALGNDGTNDVIAVRVGGAWKTVAVS